MSPTDNEKTGQSIQAQRDETFFPRVWVVSGKSIGVLKHGGRVCKVDPVFLSIAGSLVGVPLVPHSISVCTNVHGARK